MTRREQIIEILEIWYDYIINDDTKEDIADAILALPLDIPTDKEIENYTEIDRDYLIDYEVHTRDELRQRIIGRREAIKWLKFEIIKRSKL
jgi:hypothetical protein